MRSKSKSPQESTNPWTNGKQAPAAIAWRRQDVKGGSMLDIDAYTMLQIVQLQSY